MLDLKSNHSLRNIYNEFNQSDALLHSNSRLLSYTAIYEIKIHVVYEKVFKSGWYRFLPILYDLFCK